MSFLFDIDGNKCRPKAEILLVEPFKGLWSKDERKAVNIFSFAELYTSKFKSNPYAGYSDDIRLKLLSKQFLGKEYEVLGELPEDVRLCVEFLEDVQTNGSFTYKYYKAALRAASELQSFLLSVDINERNVRTGAPIYKPTDITKSIIECEDALNKLVSLRAKVEQELFESSKTKGGKTISPFANPDMK